MPGDSPYVKHLLSLGSVCDAAVVSARGRKNAADAWQNPVRADWMVWWAAKTSANSKAEILRCLVSIANGILSIAGGAQVLMTAIDATSTWVNNSTDQNSAACRTAALAARESLKTMDKLSVTHAAAKAIAWTAWSVVAEDFGVACRTAVSSAQKANPTNDLRKVIAAQLKQPWIEPKS